MLPHFLFLAADGVHRGSRNDDLQEDRKVIFSVFAKDPFKDDYQIFQWNHAEVAFGFGSPEHTAALVKNKAFRPDTHETRPSKISAVKRILGIQ